LNRYAVISDIHGNIWALEAVLADANQRDIRQIINLGDTLYGPLEPQATADRLMQLALVSIQGNEDRLLVENPPAAISPTLEYNLKNLTASSCAWLAAQPATQVFEETLFFCHGTPHSDEIYLVEGMSNQGGFLLESQFIQAQLDSASQTVILCGHSHIPRAVYLPDGRLIVNPGSVGLPAYRDDMPVTHKMESGSPHARYAVLTQTPTGWLVEHIALPYPWVKAAAQARRNGRNDWALWLESGRA